MLHEPVDFFARCGDAAFMASVDFILDNPPYTNADIKERVLRALSGSGKPWCMLLPMSCLHSQFLREALDMTLVQLILPRRVLVRKTDGPDVPFKQLVWLCYRCQSARDVYFIE